MPSLNKLQLNQELNIFHSKRNILNTIKLKQLKESHTKEKSLNTKKFIELKEFHSKEPSLIIMQLKLKSNIFQKKLNRLLLNMNQSKKLGKEFNIYQSKLKLFTTQKEITTSLKKANILKPVMLKDTLIIMFHTLIIMSSNQFNTSMLFTTLITFQFNTLNTFNMQVQFTTEDQLFMEEAISTEPPLILPHQFILQDKHTPLELNMLLEVNMLLEDKHT